MPIGHGMHMHATANEEAWILVNERACLLLTQVKTRDPTVSKNYYFQKNQKWSYNTLPFTRHLILLPRY